MFNQPVESASVMIGFLFYVCAQKIYIDIISILGVNIGNMTLEVIKAQ